MATTHKAPKSSRRSVRRQAWTCWAETGTAPVASSRDHRDEEHQHQVALMTWRDGIKMRFPSVGLLFAIPNGGLRKPRTAGRLKAEGAQDGVPDLLLPVAQGDYAGLFIEMKSSVGRLSARQRHWHEALISTGYRVEIARHWTQACSLIVEHLALPQTLIPPPDTAPHLAVQITPLLLGQRHSRTSAET